MTTDPEYQKIGTVHNLDGTTAEIGVNCNMVTVDMPLQLLPDQQEVFRQLYVKAWRVALRNDAAMAGSDGGDD